MLNKTHATVAVLMAVSLATLSGCGNVLATNADYSNLSSLTDKEFCEISHNRFNFEGPRTDAINAEELRRFGRDDDTFYTDCSRILHPGLYSSSTTNNRPSPPSAQTNVEPEKTRQPVSPAQPYVAPSNSGLTSIIPNPQTPANQALAICRPQANAAKSQASSQASRPSRSSSYDTSCRRDYFGNYDCTSRESSGGGGFWGGVADGMASSGSGRTAYNSVLSSCLATYGWRN
jgi:hypothetical protein